MADAVTTRVLADGRARYAAVFTNISDGTGEAAVTKIDVSALSAGPNGEPCIDLAITRIRYTTVGMSVRILWDATADVPAWILPADGDGDQVFDAPLVNPRGAGWTGDIQFTTVGHTSGDTYSIEIEARKKF